MEAANWKTGGNVTTENLSSPSHQVSSTPCALASVLVAPAFKSLRHEHPKFLLAKALFGLPADSSFTIYSQATGQYQTHTPCLSTVTFPDLSEIAQLGTKAPSTRKPSQTT